MKIILIVEKPDPAIIENPAVELTDLLDAGGWDLITIATEDCYEIKEKK